MEKIKVKNMSNYPMVSVLMAVFNAEKFLADAVNSVVSQTFNDFEFVVIDDGSTDDSLKILQSFAHKDKRIRIYSRENRGLVESLNEGLKLCNAPLVARMDADDISLPERFQEQVNYLSKNPQCVLVGSRVIIIDADNDQICEMGDYFDHDDIDNGLLNAKGQLIYHPSVMLRKEAVIIVGGYRKEYPQVEDLDLFLRLAEVGKLANIKHPLLKYREHFNKIGHVYREQQSKQIREVLVNAYIRRGLKNKEVINDFSLSLVNKATRFNIWGWWALKAGNLKTAKKYAGRSFWLAPFRLDTWRLIYCVMRGY